MQLVAYGAQDIYLTGNPQITFFKVVYRRHTNFSMESIRQTFNGTADFGSRASATISRNGDLIHRMYLEHDVVLKASGGTRSLSVTQDYGSYLMKEVELEIGGQMIDRYYGHYHAAQSKLRQPNSTGEVNTAFNRMSGNCTRISSSGTDTGMTTATGWQAHTEAHTVGYTGLTSLDVLAGKFFIPLYFWFCCNVGLSLPLIALQYHEVKVQIQFEDIGNLASEGSMADYTNGSNSMSKLDLDDVHSKSFNLWVDYIYLDTDERRRFAQVSHEYLIEQLQYETASEATGGGTNGWSHTLNFNHPVKELIFNIGKKFISGTNTDTISDSFPTEEITATTLQLKLNGHDRFAARDKKYFTRVQVLQHHSGFGGYGTTGVDSIGVYSFALKPEEHQPSGTCNFSRIDNAVLEATGTQQTAGHDFHIYAVNYNVLRIMSGMGGLAYSN